METYTGHANKATEISGWMMVRNPNPTGDQDKNQIQYEISWAPTFIEPWLLDYHTQAGYHPTHQQLIDRETITNTQASLNWDTPCEVCNSPHSLHDYQDMIICSTCYKTYHTTCLGTDNPHSNHLTEDQHWDCPACLHHTHQQGPGPAPFVQVHWPKTWEPASNLTSPELLEMISTWTKAHAHSLPPHRDKEEDSDLPNITRQGHGPDLQRPWISHRDNCRTGSSSHPTRSIPMPTLAPPANVKST